MSKFSYRSLKLIALDHERKPLSEATAFTYMRSGKAYIVTNWHVVMGKNPNTEDWMPGCSQERRPFWLRVIWPNPHNIAGPTERTLPLYDFARRTESGSLYPLFNTADGIFPELLPHVDVAVVPAEDDVAQLVTYEHYDGHTVPVGTLSITDAVYVVGYPQHSGMGPGRPPIWTRGSIASEPNVVGGRANLLIDARTRPGQSGSPVIQYRRSFTHMADGGLTEEFAEKAELIGIYSGRTDQESDLGRVWSTSIINDAIDHGTWWD